MSCLIFQLYISVTGQNVPPVKTSQSVSVEMSHCYWSKRPRESKRPTNQNVPRPWSKRPMWAWPFKTSLYCSLVRIPLS